MVAHALPHVPQLRTLLERLTQAPEQLVSPLAQVVRQCPLEQTWLVPQACPQAPQFFGLCTSETHVPEHSVSPVGHTQCPPEHD